LTVTFWPPDGDTVKLDVDTLLTVPTTPPAAGPDRALEPPFAANPAFAVWPVLPAEPLPEVALTIPAAPPPITTTAAPMARALRSLRVRISISFGSSVLSRGCWAALRLCCEQAGEMLNATGFRDADEGGADR
jgi:hypothetical protein